VGGARPKALIVPHAGYAYSGPVAASAYAQLRAAGPRVERVVLIGPSHTTAHAGLALPEAAAFLTPLGAVPVDTAASARAAALRQVAVNDGPHLREHAVEVQLPFLQVLLDRFTLVPLTVGHASPEEVAEVLHEVWGGAETLVICSTDLSHYLTYGEACALDRRSADMVLSLDALALGRDQACGRTPLAGLLLEAGRRRLSARLLDLRHSGDTGGDLERVVGYGAFALDEPAAAAAHPGWAGGPAPEELERARRAALLTGLARAAVASLFGGPPPLAPPGEPWLHEPRACFVSLHHEGALRGCIGAIAPRATLFEELVGSARAAASRDPRFDPVTPLELPGLDLEVSVLSPLEPLPAEDEAAALRSLRPGVDGLVLAADGRTATFIPAVWEEVREPREFLRQLRRKAGLPDRWLPGTTLQRFTAERYLEPG
jgi:AmmeMemoRadiSam system protein B/AmmeMemoRadiSam system protein A